MEDFEEDFTKPLLLGYLRRDLLVADSQVANLERQMAQFARVEGFSMGFTYVEEQAGWPMAFEALIESVNRYRASAIVVPHLLHLTALDGSFDAKDTFERATGARVLMLEG
ncbi:hypothetical protein G3I17_21730 [Streptomyces sp. SID13031]|nr:hypothetical protein [Streptomyces sp. SID13031]